MTPYFDNSFCYSILIYWAERLGLSHLIWALYEEQFLQAYEENVNRLYSLEVPTVFHPSYLQYLHLIPQNNPVRTILLSVSIKWGTRTQKFWQFVQCYSVIKWGLEVRLQVLRSPPVTHFLSSFIVPITT